MIWELVKKDVIFLVTSLKSTLLAIIVLGLFLPLTGLGFGIAMPALVCYIGFYGVLAYEERSKMQLLDLALPVTRKEICLSKYVYALGLVIFSTLLSSLGSGLGILIEGEKISEFIRALPLYMTLMVTIALIYLSVVMPCIFYWGTIKARYILMGIYILIFVAASSMNGVIMGKISESFNGYLSGCGILLVVMIAIICIAISIGISLRIWENKDVR